MNLQDRFFNSLISFLLGLVLSSTIYWGKKIFALIKNWYHVRQLRKSDIICDEHLHIYSIENAIPHYAEINVFTSECKLFVEVPKEFVKSMPSGFEFNNNISFNGKDNFIDLVDQTGIYNLADLIKQHSAIVAKDFISGNKGYKFNGGKYGVLNVDIGMRKGINEMPIATITTFETDFFTYRVFYSIYDYLRNINHPISQINTIQELLKYNCFICSIGINAAMIVNSEKYSKEEILFTKRSSNVINHRNMFSVSMIEGVSLLDYSNTTGKISLENCLFRGISEEIGISEDYHRKNNTKYTLNDIFISKETFDFGITCTVKINGIFSKEIEAMIAKDRKFEIDKVIFVPLIKKEILEFVRERNFVPQSLFTLNTYFIRKYGYSITIPRKKKE
ncbi:MAG: hypothetical protein FWH57_04975 [Oscillospiraceae bacterium]|nr:hypothetical protein [Oscillospiraceae bacterium]